MTDYAEIAQALVDYGYVDDTDLEAVADVLANNLVLTENERDEATLEAEAVADTVTAADDVPLETIDQVEVYDDVMNVAGDAEILAGGDAIFGATFIKTADALLDADLIDRVNALAVASLIAEYWLDEEV